MLRTKAEIEWNKKQALWFMSCSKSHNLFCNCGNWVLHVKKRWGGMDFAAPTIKGGHFVDHFIVRGGGDGFAPGAIIDPVASTQTG